MASTFTFIERFPNQVKQSLELTSRNQLFPTSGHPQDARMPTLQKNLLGPLVCRYFFQEGICKSIYTLTRNYSL